MRRVRLVVPFLLLPLSAGSGTTVPVGDKSEEPPEMGSHRRVARIQREAPLQGLARILPMSSARQRLCDVL